MAKTRIAYFTDTHLGQRLVMGGTLAGDKMRYDDEPEQHWSNLRLVLEDISNKGLSDVVFGGDIGTRNSVDGFFELLARYRFATSLTPGNHDHYADVARNWPRGGGAVEGKICYCREYGAFKGLFLDTSDNQVGEAQLGWLARELQSAGKIVLFVHHPVLEIDTPLDRMGAALRDRQQLKELLVRTSHPVSVFCGHYHMEHERSEANIRQFVTPAVSYQIAKQAERIEVDTGEIGYRIIDIDDSGITTEIVRLASPSMSAESR